MPEADALVFRSGQVGCAFPIGSVEELAAVDAPYGIDELFPERRIQRLRCRNQFGANTEQLNAELFCQAGVA